MSGKHAIRVACFVVLAIVMPYAIPSPFEGEGHTVRHKSGREDSPGFPLPRRGRARVGVHTGDATLSGFSPHPALPPPGGKGHNDPLASRVPNTLEGEGWVGGLRHRRGGYGMWYIAYSAAQAHAAEPALLRASVAKPGPVLVGEHVTMIVELLTATTFASAPVFEFPKIPGAILMQIEARPILGTEEVDGETYTVQRHELALFVMKPGVAQIPTFTVRFESAPRFGEKPIEYRLTAPAL